MTAAGPDDGGERIDDPSPTDPGAKRGMRQLTSESFDSLEAIGGWRGMVESVAPGLVFVVVFVAVREIMPAVIASVGVAVVATIARLVQRTPITQAVGGLLGVGIGAIWAWRSGEAQNFFAWGLITNAAFAVGVTISIVARWPVVGFIVATLFQRPHTWREDKALMRRYTLASWLWVGAFALRLAVQVPLYLGGDTGWLGAARLVMGLPLWALVLWVTWVMVNPRAEPEAAPDQQDPATTR